MALPDFSLLSSLCPLCLCGEFSLTDLVFDDPCVLFALRWEARAFYRAFRPQQRFPGAPCRASFCGPEWLSVLVLETGLGPQRAEVAVNWLLSEPRLGKVPCRPKVVLSAGFSGALREELAVGDVILATEVVDAYGDRWPATWPGELPPGEWRPPLHRGRVLFSPRLVGDPHDKQRLGLKHAALAVDMESGAVARCCREHGVPFGCVRVISDALTTPLSPVLLTLLSGARVSPLRVAGAALASPTLMKELWRLGRAAGRAADQLQQALGELLTLTLPFGREL
jgi:nucleoside phosphorylase